MSQFYVHIARSWFVWAIVVNLTGQPADLLAAEVAAVRGRSNIIAPDQHRVGDVALQQGDVLHGQVVNASGTGKAEMVVQLVRGQQRWQAKTNSYGWFQFTGLRGGVYQFQAAGQTQLLRVWAAGTAPPHARRGILVTPTTKVIRGQRVVSPNTNQFFRVAKQRLANPLVVGGIVATAVTIPVAIHNADDDDPPATP